MADDIANLVVEHVRVLRADSAQVKERLVMLAGRLNAEERRVAGLSVQMAEISGRLDPFIAVSTASNGVSILPMPVPDPRAS